MEEKRIRCKRILGILKREFLRSACRLSFETPYELLIKTILSAQCTDERVNLVGTVLFKKYKTMDALAFADQNELESDIRPAGLFRSKARQIKACSAALLEDFGGQVPNTMKDLLRLPGVGRKTANVILGNAFGKPALAVDTHVIRISRLLGLTEHNHADRIESDLMNLLPEKEWITFSHIIADHGRATCSARRPQCGRCPVEKECPSSSVKPAARHR